MTRPALLPLPTVVRLGLAGLLALSLSGCISLLPKTTPSQLYRFGVPVAAAPARPDPVGVFRLAGGFQREAAGDRILTITSDRASYIAQTRWVAPAETLFDEAVSTAFDGAPGRVRLVPRGDPTRADLALRLDVRNFETRYGEGRTPVVLIRIRAVLARDRAPVAEQIFEARVPAKRNRVTAIVAAYNTALGKVLGEVAAWTNSSAA
jgi:cholesterol transport system auxiliary component